MKKKLLTLYTITFCLFLLSCKENLSPKIQVKPIHKDQQERTAVYFTQDQKGNPVICWSELSKSDSLYRLMYAVFDAKTESFSVPVRVPGSAGLSTSAESVGKIAFKSDGTVMALFGKRFKKEKNSFAGAIYATYSKDEGKTWSKNSFLHTDTAHHYGRSFFDITTLKDGELAAIWLDGRYGKEIKGSALFFARTAKGTGFTADSCLEKGTCECCRTNLVKDEEGNLHVAFRNISYPSDLSGKQVRDMAYLYSKDNGMTFTAPKTISEDNWQIEGCPHSGPSMAVTGQLVNGVWFTAGGTPGIYYTAGTVGETFKKRTLLSASGRHPQMAALPNGKVAIVFEENLQVEQEPAMKMDHGSGAMNMTHGQAGKAKIILKIFNQGKEEKSMEISDGQDAAHHAVLTAQKDGILVAWISEKMGKPNVYYARVGIDQ